MCKRKNVCEIEYATGISDTDVKKYIDENYSPRNISIEFILHMYSQDNTYRRTFTASHIIPIGDLFKINGVSEAVIDRTGSPVTDLDVLNAIHFEPIVTSLREMYETLGFEIGNIIIDTDDVNEEPNNDD